MIVLVPRLLFQQDCMACQLERVWKLNFMLLHTLSFPADFLHGLKVCLSDAVATSVTSIMLFSEMSLYPNIENCFRICYMVISGK